MENETAPAHKDNAWLDRLKHLEVPHPLIIIAVIILLAAAATYLLPSGAFERVEKDGRQIAVAGTYHPIPQNGQGPLKLAVVPFEGLVQAAEVCMFLFIVGGAFGVIKYTGALTAGICKITHLLKGREMAVIPVLMTLFALGGGTFGMYEEVLPFVSLVVPMTLAMGYDSIVGIAIVYMSTTLGFCGAFLNPFTVGVAQGVAGLPPFSGIGYRLVVWVVLLATGITYVMIYAARVKKNPRLSSTYESDCAVRKCSQFGEGNGFLHMTGRHAAVLVALAVGLLALPLGVMSWKWGMKELSGLFLSIGLVSALAGGANINKAVDAFVEGAKEMVTAVLLIGLARGVKVVLDDGYVMDTLLYYMAAGISHFPKLVAVQIMFLVQCFINLFIQSGSAQAAISMPIMSPLANMLGITSQTAVLAFQLGDGFANFAIPWNGLTLAVLSLGMVPIWAWFRWAFKLQLLLVAVCMLLLIWPTLTAWGPF